LAQDLRLQFLQTVNDLSTKRDVNMSCLFIRSIAYPMLVGVLMPLSHREEDNHEMSQLSMASSRAVDCVLPKCGQEKVLDEKRSEAMMCYYAKLARTDECDDTFGHWEQKNAFRRIASTCAGGGSGDITSVLSQAFAQQGCMEGDICSAAAARLGVFLTACGIGTNNKMGADIQNVICPKTTKELGIPERYNHPETCEALATSLGGVERVIQLLKSLQCGCETLSGNAGKSGAVIQRSWDYKYILKQIPGKHAEKYKTVQFPADIPIINQILYADLQKEVVIMPNGLFAETFGLRAQPSACKISMSKTFDIKPPGCNPIERHKFLTKVVEKNIKLKDWGNYDAVQLEINRATEFFHKNNLVDYSLLVGQFEVDCGDEQCESVDSPKTQCITSPEGWQPKTVLCVSFIDYLMDFAVERQLENKFVYFKKFVWVKDLQNVANNIMQKSDINYCAEHEANKWSDYHLRHQSMWACMGDLSTQDNTFCKCLLREGCQKNKGHAWCREFLW